MKVRIHNFEPYSRANGPGIRSVLWFQGCSLGCPGCFNPDTHDPRSGVEVETDEIAHRIRAAQGIEGVSFSGGEPFQQPEALLDLIYRMAPYNLSFLAFSGYTKPEIMRLSLGPEIMEHLDVLVAGRFVSRKRSNSALLGSTNQEVHFLTTRYSADDTESVGNVEIIIKRDGSVVQTGMKSLLKN